MSPVFTVLAILLSLTATILAFVFIVPGKRRARLNRFGQFLHDLCNFKFLIIEKILQFCYIFATAMTLIGGFFMLFTVVDYYYSSEWIGYYGLIVMIVGPILIRVAYELLMMAILAVKNIIQINNKLKNQNENVENTSPFGMPTMSNYMAPMTPVAPVVQPPVPAAPAYVPSFCQNCGSPLNADGTCGNPLCQK